MQSSPTTAPEPVIRHSFPDPNSFAPDDASYYRQSRGTDLLSGDQYVAPGEEAEPVEKEDAGTGMGRPTPLFDRFDLWFGGGRDLRLVPSPASSPFRLLG